ncbi:MAG: hypothetical protein P1U36_01425 [Legionellaceae bacterium]|nr:hypothetical protein [Legionellaceae bacterium]
MTSEEQSPQEDTPNPIEYIQQIIQHVTNKAREAQTLLEQKEFLGAQASFDNALNHYKDRATDLTHLQLTLVPSLDKISHEDSIVPLDDYRTCLGELINTIKKIAEDRSANAEKAANQAKEIQREQEVTSLTEELNGLRTRSDEIHDRLSQLNFERSPPDRETDHDETILHDSIHAALDMQVLAGFITALGVTAIAIAFAALNLAGLALPGIALGGFGLVTTMIGGSIFCSSANSIHEYTDNLYESFCASTTAP